MGTLRKLDLETVEEMVPTATKAGKKSMEIRDTAHPCLVTEMLMALLASLGKPLPANQIHKRIRDDAVWDSALLPWRRSCSLACYSGNSTDVSFAEADTEHSIEGLQEYDACSFDEE